MNKSYALLLVLALYGVADTCVNAQALVTAPVSLHCLAILLPCSAVFAMAMIEPVDHTPWAMGYS